MTDRKSKLVFFDRKMFEAKDFWMKSLARDVDVSNLPLDHPRPKVHRAQPRAVAFEVTGALRRKIATLSGDKPLLVYALFLATLKVVLHRMTGARIVVVGSPARGAEGEPNALPILTEIDAELSFRDLLVQVRQTLLDAYANQSYPFAALAKDFGLEQVDNKCPLFDVALSLAGYHGELPPVKNDLSISLVVEAARIAGRIEFNAELHDAASVERLASGIMTVLASGLHDSSRTIRALEVLTDAELHRVLREWNTTPGARPAAACLHELIAAQVDRAPGAVAVVCAGESLTYGELDDRANRLAHHLRSLGVGPEVVVGLCVEPSLHRVIGALGILKAGGAFLPLDPDYPRDRLAFMLEDARVPVVLTQAALESRLPQTRAHVVRLDGREAPVIAAESPSRPSSALVPGNAAYVIYTSGSTGRPKGAVCAHRGLANLAAAQIAAFAVTEASRVLQFSSFSFDASVSEIAMALAAGATLVLDRREVLFPGEGLMRFLADQSITHLTIAPSVLALLPAAPLPDLATLVVAGEACPAEVVEQWAPGRRFLNAYGPTETTVCATLGAVEARDGASRPSIGRPMAGIEVYILDDGLQPVVPGMSGELCIGGVGLARGYLGNPATTAEKFVPHPFSDTPGARLYRSGDRARHLPDGTLDFQGRMDSQVKIRGFRIELGEIEAVLATSPMVGESAVLCREDTPGVKRLVAYVAPSGDREPTESGLREHLKSVLPDYLVPEAFVILPALPKTSKLTIAREKLPPPKAVKRDAPLGLVHARDAVELGLVQIWERVLGKTPIGVRDNFFELGGHSFLAVKLLSEIRERFDRDLPLPTLLQAPTVEELASVLRVHDPGAPWSPIVSIRPTGTRPPLFCVHPAGGTVLCYADLASALGPEQPFHGLQEFGLIDGQTPLARIEDMAALYVSAMRALQPDGPYLLAGWSFGGLAAFEMAQQLRAKGQEIALLAMFDTYAPAALSPQLQAMDEIQRIMSLFGDDVDLSEAHLRRLAPDERLAYVLQQSRAVDLVPPSFSVDEIRRVIDLFTVNSAAVHAYRPQPYPGAVTVFAARDKTQAIASVTSDEESHGWAALARGGVTLQWVEGNHHTMMRKPHVQAVGERLRAAVDAVLPALSTGRG